MDFILTAQTRIQLLFNYYINYRIASDGSAGLLARQRVPGQPSNFTFNIWWLLPRHSLPSFTFCLLVLYLLFSLSLFLLYFYIRIMNYYYIGRDSELGSSWEREFTIWRARIFIIIISASRRWREKHQEAISWGKHFLFLVLSGLCVCQH